MKVLSWELALASPRTSILPVTAAEIEGSAEFLEVFDGLT